MFFTDDSGSIKASLKKRITGKYVSPRPLKKPSILNLKGVLTDEIGSDGESIVDRIYGLNPRDILNLSDKLRNRQDAVVDTLHDYAERAAKPGPAWMIEIDDRPVGYSLVEPSLATGESTTKYDSALLLYEAYYAEATGQEFEEGRLQSLLALLEKEIYRHSRKIEDLQKAVARNKESMDFKKYGELILANLGQIKKGSRTVRLEDIETSPPDLIEIKLDPARTPAANAEAYFKKYRKAIASEKILRQRLKTAQERVELLYTIRADHGHDHDLLEEQLRKHRIISAPRGFPSRKKQEKRKPFREYRASCGWEILVGKSNADNDELTFKIAARHDFWFHAWQAAGSHTILRLPARNSMPDKKTLQEAASLAAYFSRARKSSKVPVIYTQVRHVRKPRKFPPGKVVVEREKQLIIEPGNPDEFAVTDDQ
jgi:predicted ribosome quality control (RQC) complex YloA/Tae2 family protein